jgi:hypothetical protein
MSDKSTSIHREAMEREKARLLEEAAAKQAAAEAIDRDMAEIDRLAALAARYGFVVTAPSQDGAKKEGAGLDGRLTSLIDCYQVHPESSFHKLGFGTRKSYISSLGRLQHDLGPEQIDSLDNERLQRQYDEWIVGGHIAMGHSLIGMLRILASFGSTVLKDQSCRILRTTLHHMRFKKAKKKNKPLTIEHVIAIRASARAKGFPSVALAQAIQFESKLGQRDVIGDWVPVGESGTSEVTLNGLKWLRGLRWNEIDENLELRRSTGKNQKPFDLKRAPMVIEELRAMFCKFGEPLTRARLPPSGPIIKYERTKLPYQSHQFRRVWRLMADAAKIPKDVHNMGSSSATDAPPDPDADFDLEAELEQGQDALPR